MEEACVGAHFPCPLNEQDKDEGAVRELETLVEPEADHAIVEGAAFADNLAEDGLSNVRSKEPLLHAPADENNAGGESYSIGRYSDEGAEAGAMLQIEARGGEKRQRDCMTLCSEQHASMRMRHGGTQ